MVKTIINNFNWIHEQVTLQSTYSEPIGTTTPVVAEGGISFYDYMLQEFGIEFNTTTYSIFKNPVFKNLSTT